MLTSVRVSPLPNRILFVPGKNPKPSPAEHRAQLFRCLLHGIGRADPAAARELAAAPDAFTLIPWNVVYYDAEKPLGADRPWIDALLTRTGPTEDEVREALSWRRKAARVMVSVADFLPFLIPLLPDPAVKSTIRETERYFSNFGGIAGRVRERLKAPLREMLARGERILLIGHSMGSVIAYDVLWELWHVEGRRERIDAFLSLGSPLGMRFTQRRLRGARERGARCYPGNIRRWLNIAAEGDLTALDPTVADDFAPMLALGQVEKIVDIDSGIFNYFRNAEGLNVHRSYGYLVNPRVGEVIAKWWRG
jgi:pimeloyl-ACP methyl ester carboxylesterase